MGLTLVGILVSWISQQANRLLGHLASGVSSSISRMPDLTVTLVDAIELEIKDRPRQF